MQSSVCPLDLPLPFALDSTLGHLSILLSPQDTGGATCPKLEQSHVSGKTVREICASLRGGLGSGSAGTSQLAGDGLRLASVSGVPQWVLVDDKGPGSWVLCLVV